MRTAIACTLLIWSVTLAPAYDPYSHERLGRESVADSVLVNEGFGHTLGLDLATERFFGPGGYLTALQRVPQGANLEDTPIYRRGSHFFDPAHAGRPLSPCLAYPFLLGGVPIVCHSSADWALEDGGQNLPLQSFSLARARTYFIAALAGAQAADRGAAFGLVFESLGHVLHMIQDIAQPEHVRNDIHLGPDSHYEPDTRDTYGQHLVSFSGAYGPDHENASLVSMLGLLVPRDVWASASGGLARFTNRTFVSESTNFRPPYSVVGSNGQLLLYANTHPEYFLPHALGVKLNVKTWAQLQSELPPYPNEVPLSPPPSDGKLYFVELPVLDPVLGATADFNGYGSTLSIFDHDLNFYGTDPCNGADLQHCQEARFTLNYANFRAARQLLLPRAISYGAALINYFFRGVWRDGHPVLRLQASDLGTPQGMVSVTNDSDLPLDGGDLVVYYDHFATQTRVELTRVSGTIPAGATVSIGTPQSWTTLLSEMEPGGEIAFLYTGHVSTDPNAISVAGRVCDCGKVAVASDSDPDAECKPFCPCKYLAFDEGDPQEVGDGTTVSPSIVYQTVCDFTSCPTPPCCRQNPLQVLTLAEPLPWAIYPRGMTVLVFSPDRTDLRYWVTFAGTLSTDTCGGFGTGPNESFFIPVDENGIEGRAIPYSRAELDILDQGSFDSGCRFRLSYGTGPPFCGFRCFGVPVDIDAVKVCPGTP